MLNMINKSKSGVRFAAFLIISVLTLPQILNAASTVSQFGITWTFDKDYTTGQFANGDYWVVGPVTITSINPPSTAGSRVKNGSQVNPSGGSSSQGYDSSMAVSYSASLNKALTMPLTLPAGSSLISSISQDSAGALPQLRTAAILTVLSSAPPAGSFRPPYCGSNKTIKFNKSQLDYSKLAKLTPAASTPVLETVNRMFERPWLDHVSDWSARYLHPSDNMPDYSREMADYVGTGALSLHLNYTDSQKETLMIRFVQLGIDNYGIIANDGQNNWNADGGHASGRKWPILFAGIVLNDPDMKAIGTDTRFKSYLSPYAAFGEDLQTFYVSQADIAITNHRDQDGLTQQNYVASDLGLPEWGIRHYENPVYDDRGWYTGTKSDYRVCCTAAAWTGEILAAHIMGAKQLWNHDALFDYQDRYVEIATQYRCWSSFPCDMWDRYRADYGCVWTRYNPADFFSNGSNGCDSNSPSPTNQTPNANAGQNQTVTDTDNNGSQSVTLNGSGSSDSDGTIASYVWREGSTQLATGATPSVTFAVGTHTITLTVTDNGGLTAIDTVIVLVVTPGDTTPPSVLSVTASGDTVEVIFNETLNQTSATNIGNYVINQGLSINSATLDSVNNKVILSTTTQTDGVVYTLSVINVADTSGNLMALTTRDFSYTEGLVGYWKFNDGEGLAAADSSGNSNTATLINGATWTIQGEIGFDGNNDIVEVSTNKMSVGQGSIAAWIYPNSFPKSRNYIFGHNGQFWGNRIQLYCNQAGTLGLGLGNNANLKTDIQTLNAQQWCHIILTWNGTNYAVYVDGIQKAAGSYSGLNYLSTYADIGNNGNSSTRNEAFDGLVDEVKIYNRMISAGEISNLALPFLPIDDKTVAEGKELNFAIRIKSGVITELSDNDLPGTPSLTSNIFRWTPGYSDAGVYGVEFSAQQGLSASFEKIILTVTNAEPSEVNMTGEIGWWPFDETIGQATADLSGSDNTGYLKNGLAWVGGKINGALEFSVPNDAVEIATTNFNPVEGTIAMWIYINRLTLARHYLFGQMNSDLANRIQLYLKYGDLCVGLGDSFETAINIQRLESRQWYHVTLTWSGTGFKVYIDGVLQTAGAFSGLTGFGPTADIGNSGANNDKALNGKIDDLRIYNRALSAVEIALIAN
jgi:hypothetical protein